MFGTGSNHLRLKVQHEQTLLFNADESSIERTLTIWPRAPLQHEVYGVDGPGGRVRADTVRSGSGRGRLEQLPESFKHLCL